MLSARLALALLDPSILFELGLQKPSAHDQNFVPPRYANIGAPTFLTMYRDAIKKHRLGSRACKCILARRWQTTNL